MVRVFLDCNQCDEDYVRKEVTFIDYVRNREDCGRPRAGHDPGNRRRRHPVDAEVHRTGHLPGIGSDAHLQLAGDRHVGRECAAGFTEVFKVGLVRYAATTPMVDRLRVTFKKVEGEDDAAKTKDPWNYWVYRVGMSGDVNGEESSSGRSIRGSASTPIARRMPGARRSTRAPTIATPSSVLEDDGRGRRS